MGREQRKGNWSWTPTTHTYTDAYIPGEKGERKTRESGSQGDDTGSLNRTYYEIFEMNHWINSNLAGLSVSWNISRCITTTKKTFTCSLNFLPLIYTSFFRQNLNCNSQSPLLSVISTTILICSGRIYQSLAEYVLYIQNYEKVLTCVMKKDQSLVCLIWWVE